jgi:hypothetical protein
MAIGFTPAFANAYMPGIPNIQGFNTFTIEDNLPAFEGHSFLTNSNTRIPKYCGATGAPDCDYKSNKYFGGNLIAPVCSKASQTNCIEGLKIYKTGEPVESAQFDRYVEGTKTAANAKLNLTEGASTSLWESPVMHAGGSGQYAVRVRQRLLFSDGKFVATAFDASVMPTNPKYGGDQQNVQFRDFAADPNTERWGLVRMDPACSWQEDATCGVLQDFAADTRVALTLRVEKATSTWYKGRMTSPDISVKDFGSSSIKVTLDAAPVEVGVVSGLVPVEAGSDSGLAKFLEARPSMARAPGGGGSGSAASSPYSMVAIEQLRKTLKDKVAGINTIWSVGSLSNVEPKLAKCSVGSIRVQGIVTTNSAIYMAGPPALSGGSLTYEVASLHFAPDGETPLNGTYDLVMRSDVARCLYGFSKAPLSASVTVSNEKGIKSTATTVVSEENGWLKMAAYGFTFSKKTIKIKLTGTKKK